MGPSESDVSRLMAGKAPVDDPGLSDVADFLGDLRHAYPPASVDAVRESHLAAVAQQAQREAESPSPRRRRVGRRTVAVVSVAALSVFTAGVGVAAAMGADPLALLPGLRFGPPEVPRSTTPVPVASEPVPLPSPLVPSATSTWQPTTAGVGNRKPTPTPSVKATARDETRTNNGKADEAKAEHKPTAMPSQAKNDKADPPAKGRSQQKPSPPPNRGRADG